MDYKIVVQTSVEELEVVVKKLLQNDWKPLGSPHFNGLGSKMWYQAMIKEN